MADFSGSRGDLHEASRPTTPTYSRSTKAHPNMRALNTGRPSQQETFFDDATPVDNSHYADRDYGPPRDSHDLSFSDGTRDSVVDNMLLSLDQLTNTGPPGFANSSTLYSNVDNDDFFLTNTFPNPPRAARHRGHTHASSHSSDYDIHLDDTSSRYSGHRGRRSNSSSNFQNILSRKESLRGGYAGSRDKQSKGMFGDFGSSSHSRGQGKKGSKSSGSSSMDFGYSQVLGTQRLTFGHRSASFDQGSVLDRGRIEPGKGESILDRSRADFAAYDYDAAPEPTIPAGPRRTQETPQASPSYPPPLPSYVPAPAIAPGRRNSVRSATSRTLRKNKSQPEPNMRQQAQDFVNAQTMREMPGLPMFQNPPAPSPTVAMRKPMFPQPSTPIAPPKEKQGFFRRVFGGSSKNQQSQQSSVSQMSSVSYQNPPQPSPGSGRRGSSHNTYGGDAQLRPRTTPSSSTHIASQLKALPKAPPTAPAQKETQPPQQPLAKKHSSFFRRRKKSVTEKPPIMNLNFQPPKPDFLPSQPSPSISSLRKVMNPYFNDLGSPAQERRERKPSLQEITNNEYSSSRFSPGYRPHKDATVRTVRSESRTDDRTPPSSRGEQVLRNPQLLSTDSPKLKLKIKRGKTNISADLHDDSFLADSSSCNEERVTPRSERHHERTDETRRPKTSPHRSPSQRQQQLSLAEANQDIRLHPRTMSASASASEVEDDGWVLTAPTSQEQTSLGRGASRSRRVWLHPTASEEKLSQAEGGSPMSLPLEGARVPVPASSQTHTHTSAHGPHADTPTSSTSDVFHTPVSAFPPDVGACDRDQDQPGSAAAAAAGKELAMPSIVEQRASLDAPTDDDRERALKIFSGDEVFVNKDQAAAMLGDPSPLGVRTRKAYMELFDWAGLSILQALRDLCQRLVLRAETQQVDRILMSFSDRWCDCNPNHGFKATDVVHTICYSVLLLNTDLHLADIESRMTKSQFVRNTLPTVRRVCAEAIKELGEETLRPQSTQVRGPIPWDRTEPSSPGAAATAVQTDTLEEPETRRARSRLSVKPPVRGAEGVLNPSDPLSSDNCTILVNSPYRGSMRGWEEQVEVVLKEFYNSIRQQRLPLHGASPVQTHDPPSSNNLSVSSVLRRTPSVLSKAPSDTVSYRGRSQTDFRSGAPRWQSKTRSKGRLYPASTVASSRTSLDDGSVWSPAGSSSWSRYSYSKTQPSMSMESLGSHFAHGDYQQAIGFANALSQAIIREEGMSIHSNEEIARVAPLLEDESLELAGAPWAKEGILKHKHHLEAVDKKSKDRAWTECFAVIEKGYMRLFSFSSNSKSLRHKNKSRPSAGSVVGGGNWMDNAEALDTFLLRQSIASALPPPGYSKSRPHVWALSLPSGAVHLFQVGTPDIVREFVSTANYWSARLSKEPLIGGVSSVEYGWGENVINPALIRRESNPPVPGHVSRPSVASSIRSSVDHATGTVKPRLPGDKFTLGDWTPPQQSMMASNLMEVDQLKALTNYVKNVEDELARHNELRAPMLIAFSPRHPNAGKAMTNWEKKSAYLLREIVKFRTYIDSLHAANAAKEKIYAEREKEAPKHDEEADDAGPLPDSTSEVDGGVDAPKPVDAMAA